MNHLVSDATKFVVWKILAEAFEFGAGAWHADGSTDRLGFEPAADHQVVAAELAQVWIDAHVACGAAQAKRAAHQAERSDEADVEVAEVCVTAAWRTDVVTQRC